MGFTNFTKYVFSCSVFNVVSQLVPKPANLENFHLNPGRIMCYLQDLIILACDVAKTAILFHINAFTLELSVDINIYISYQLH